MRGGLGFLLLLGFGGVALFSKGCGSPVICVDQYSSSKTDPAGQACSLPCECNNQAYTGRCLGGICQSQKREACPVAGMTRSCDKPLDGTERCTQGHQICRAPGLMSTMWGDCLLAPQPEDDRASCSDGKDNDCDGKIDADDPGCAAFCNPGRERPCFSGDSAVRGRGLCKEGTQVCLPSGRWDLCRGEVVPTPEICNGQDDNCDGQVDEGDTCACPTPGAEQACYTGSPATAGEGICRPGKRRCLPSGRWGDCEGQITPTAEICNGLDDDCDGAVDNGLQICLCPPGQKRPCSPQSPYPLRGLCRLGIQECLSTGLWGVCTGFVTPQTEVCDGEDNDCDGLIDNLPATPENQGKECQCWPPRSTEPCYDADARLLHRGVCRAGLRNCLSTGRWGACEGQILPLPEICNGQDDDCDGQIDNAVEKTCYTGAAGTQDKGLCKGGVQTCRNGDWDSCQGEVTEKAEICDGKDNDCDGQVDETLQRTCYTGPTGTEGKGLCKGGTQTCQNGQWSAICQGEVKPQAESCNGKDDDCDGFVDNGTPGKASALTRSCYSKTSGCVVQANGTYQCLGRCKAGTQACQQGVWSVVCLNELTPLPEQCNGIDDDCDGFVDNAQTGTNDLLTRACYDHPEGGTGCVALDPQKPNILTCEPPCMAGSQRCDGKGKWEVCRGEVIPRAEICNGKDDDCDGKTDEDC